MLIAWIVSLFWIATCPVADARIGDQVQAGQIVQALRDVPAAALQASTSATQVERDDCDGDEPQDDGCNYLAEAFVRSDVSAPILLALQRSDRSLSPRLAFASRAPPRR